MAVVQVCVHDCGAGAWGFGVEIIQAAVNIDHVRATSKRRGGDALAVVGVKSSGVPSDCVFCFHVCVPSALLDLGPVRGGPHLVGLFRAVALHAPHYFVGQFRGWERARSAALGCTALVR